MLALELTILTFQEITTKKWMKNHGWTIWTINTTQNVEEEGYNNLHTFVLLGQPVRTTLESLLALALRPSVLL